MNMTLEEITALPVYDPLGLRTREVVPQVAEALRMQPGDPMYVEDAQGRMWNVMRRANGSAVRMPVGGLY